MPVIPSNSNLALLVHAINKFPEPDAMEMFILSGLIHYCEELQQIDLASFDEESTEFNVAYNMQQMATYLMDKINRKHDPTLKESNNGNSNEQTPK